jgi:hypothetical protein
MHNLSPNPAWAKLPLFDRTGWKRMAFGEFAESIGERAEPKDAQEDIYVGLEHLDPQCLHIRRWGKGCDVIGGKLRFRKGDIIFGKRRAYQRKLAVAEFGGICSAHAMVIRARPDKVLPEFLPFLMMSDRFMNRAVEISVGSLSPTINWTTLKLETFDLPPLDQQRRIAEILWAVDEVLAKVGELESEATSYLVACFNEIGGAKIGTTFQLGDVISEIMDYRGRTPKKLGMDWGGDIPALSARNVRIGFVDLSVETNYGTRKLYERWMTKGDPQRGDILFTTEAPLGNVARVENDLPFILSQRVILIRSDTNVTSNDFLAYLLRSNVFQKKLVASGSGTTALGIKVAELRKIPITLPDKANQKLLCHRARMALEASLECQAKVESTQQLLKCLIQTMTA